MRHGAYDFVRAYLRRDMVTCAQCNKPVNELELDRAWSVGDTVSVHVSCHGAHEWVDVHVNMLSLNRTGWPRRAFLRNWASHGGMSAEARRERRERS